MLDITKKDFNGKKLLENHKDGAILAQIDITKELI